MANSTDAAFQAWLVSLTALGYDHLWISNNLPDLRRRFERDPSSRLPRCPEPTVRPRDRYEEI